MKLIKKCLLLCSALFTLTLCSCSGLLNTLFPSADDALEAAVGGSLKSSSSSSSSTGKSSGQTSSSSSGWYSGSVTNSGFVVYKFTGSSVNTVYVHDSSYSSKYTSDVKVDVWYGAYTESVPYVTQNLGGTSGRVVYPNYKDTYVKVYPASSSKGGSFEIKVTDSYGNAVTLSRWKVKS